MRLSFVLAILGLVGAAREARACVDGGVCQFAGPEHIPSGGSLFGESGGGAGPTSLVVDGSTIALTVVRHDPAVFEAFIPDLPPGTAATLLPTRFGEAPQHYVIDAPDETAPVLAAPPTLTLVRVADGACTAGGLRLRVSAPPATTGEALGLWTYGLLQGDRPYTVAKAVPSYDVSVEAGQRVCVTVAATDFGGNRSAESPESCLTIDPTTLVDDDSESCAALRTTSAGALFAAALVLVIGRRLWPSPQRSV